MANLVHSAYMFASELFRGPDKAPFAVQDIPSQEGKVVLVTGGNVGLGKETILQLAKHGPAKILMATRSAEKASAAIAEIQEQLRPSTAAAPTIEYVPLDLSSFASIQAAAKQIQAATDRLDLVFLNAGFMGDPPRVTADGYEIQFGINYLGHALLTRLLLPTLLKTAAAAGSDVRVVVMSSVGHLWTPAGGIDFASLKSAAGQFSTYVRYGQSKLAAILYAKELARRHPQLRAVAVHPGVVKTNLFETLRGNGLLNQAFVVALMALVSVSVADGAKNQLWAGTAADVVTGTYYEPVGVAGRESSDAKSADLAKRLWEWSEKEFSEKNV